MVRGLNPVTGIGEATVLARWRVGCSGDPQTVTFSIAGPDAMRSWRSHGQRHIRLRGWCAGRGAQPAVASADTH